MFFFLLFILSAKKTKTYVLKTNKKSYSRPYIMITLCNTLQNQYIHPMVTRMNCIGIKKKKNPIL